MARFSHLPALHFSARLFVLALSFLFFLGISHPSIAEQNNGAGFSLAADQAPVASHARMQSPAGFTVEVVTADHAAVAPTSGAGLTAFVGIFPPLASPAMASAMAFWLLY